MRFEWYGEVLGTQRFALVVCAVSGDLYIVYSFMRGFYGGLSLYQAV